jgi:hypothetical protein
MSFFKVGSIVGSGTVGILVAGLVASKMFNLGIDALLGTALTLFIVAGAVALIAKSL